MTNTSVTLGVDLDELHVMAEGLRAVQLAMSDWDRLEDGLVTAAGSPRVADALSDFVDDWHGITRKVADGLREITEKAKGAAQAYADQEYMILTACRPVVA